MSPPKVLPRTSNPPAEVAEETTRLGHPAHWTNASHSSFRNPWPSYNPQSVGFFTAMKAKYARDMPEYVRTPTGEALDAIVRVRRPDWGRGGPGSGTGFGSGPGLGRREQIKATWLGHAGFLIEMPLQDLQGTSEQDRGVNILLDAVFSDRFGPTSFLGPRRFTPPPCTIEELPDIDIVCISHNHYDHMDFMTLKTVYERRKGSMLFVVGLGLKKWFTTHLGAGDEEVLEMDWWDTATVEVNTPSGKQQVKITCCPSQHASHRSVMDDGKSLWCSWAFDGAGKKLYFAGDTAYAYTSSHDISPPDKESGLRCPAFAQIGKLLGPFDLALLPIGCYKPRPLASSVHVSPADSLAIHFDIRSRRSVAMHWGTIRGGVTGQYEAVDDSVKDWQAAAEREGVWDADWSGSALADGRGTVGVCDIGETVFA